MVIVITDYQLGVITGVIGTILFLIFIISIASYLRKPQQDQKNW